VRVSVDAAANDKQVVGAPRLRPTLLANTLKRMMQNLLGGWTQCCDARLCLRARTPKFLAREMSGLLARCA
jgi:hypothetical protein